MTSFYTREEIELLDRSCLPRHVAIIPDGNRRWAKLKKTHPLRGHVEGADSLIDIVKAAKEIGVKVITFFLFSTENWTRPKNEIDGLMWVLQSYLIAQRKTLIENGIRLQTIGDLSVLSPTVLKTVMDIKETTAKCENVEMVFALNYGSRDEMRRVFRKIANDLSQGALGTEEISESLIAKNLDTAPWGDPELLIRTSGEMRVSNFLLWQISYSEIYIDNVLWPDFTPKHFLKALLCFQERERRRGA